MLDSVNVTFAAYEFLSLSIAFRFRQHPTLVDFPLDDHPASCFPSFFSRYRRLGGVMLPRVNCGALIDAPSNEQAMATLVERCGIVPARICEISLILCHT
jgi:hypothetical protein